MKNITKTIMLCLYMFSLTACASSSSSIQTAIARTQAAWTQTAWTPIPIYTSTVTLPLASNNTPLTGDKDNGFYLIGIDIAPGVWRSTGTGDECYWAVTTKTGEYLSNHYGMSGGTAYLPETGFQVEFNNCGIWVYLGP